jgi:hypothetical protein
VKKAGFIPFAGSMDRSAGTVKVGCGADWDVVSGGVASKGLPGHGALATTGVGGGENWFVEATHGDEDKTTMNGWATCVRDVLLDDVTHVEDITAGPATEGSFVECPGGAAVLGGGVRPVGDATEWYINSLDPIDTADADTTLDDGWRAYMAYGGADPSQFLIDATCGDVLPTYRSRQVSVPVDIEGRKQRVRCPAGTHVTGGGGFLSGSTEEARLLATKPIDLRDKDRAPDDGWQAWGANSDGATKNLTVHAICLA